MVILDFFQFFEYTLQVLYLNLSSSVLDLFFLQGFLQTFADPKGFDVFSFKNVLLYGEVSIIYVSQCSQKRVVNLIHSSIKFNMFPMKQRYLFIEKSYVTLSKNSFFNFCNTFPKFFLVSSIKKKWKIIRNIRFNYTFFRRIV